jgi:long-chain acyl-CoA synthetase
MIRPALPELTLPQMLRVQAQVSGHRIAVRQKRFGIWRPTSWREYFERAADVGLGFAAVGLEHGGHVAILSENRIEWVLAQLGAGLTGAVTVGVYPTSPASEVAYVLGHADAQIVVCEDQEQVDKVLERRGELPLLRRIVVIETKGMGGYPPELVISFAELEELGRRHDAAHPQLLEERLREQSLEDIALLIYTSGSTGKPKGAMLSYRNIRAQASGASERLMYDAESVHLSYLPLCHVAEQIPSVTVPVYVGAQINFGESIRTVQEDLREVAPTTFLGVPRIWEKLHAGIHMKLAEAGGWRLRLFELAYAACEPFAETPRRRRTAAQSVIFAISYLLIFRALQNYIGLRRARMAMTGAAPIPPKIVRFFRTIGVPLVEIYGMTEGCGMLTGQRLEEMVPFCVGPAIDGVETAVAPNGELLARGDTVFVGYYKNPDATNATLAEGWLHTGDVAELDHGQVKIVDRLKDIMITAGGKNLSPSEIENTVKASPYIKECIVIGEGRKYVSALIQIDPEAVGPWAEEQGLAYTTFRSLVENEAVRALIAEEIDRANAQMAQVAQIRRFHLLTKELDHDDDEVTATMKVRRANIQAKYAAEIAALYAG